MTHCVDRELALNALFDGELDSLNAAEVEAHVRTCAACSDYLATLTDVRILLASAALEDKAPYSLRQRIAALAETPDIDLTVPKRASATHYLPWLGGGAVGALAASLALMVATPQVSVADLPDQLIAGHIRSLQAAHLTDVLTSDRHVVKPWFNGRIDFSPPVVDLMQQGYPLVGGRLDYIGDRPVAALVYRRRLHTINLFVRPAPPNASASPSTIRRHSYNIVHWMAGDLDYWAVSDVDPGDLALFHQQFAKATTP